MRNVMGDARSGELQSFRKHHHRRCAIDVVVAVQQNFLAVFDGLPETPDGAVHIFQKERIEKVFDGRVQEAKRSLLLTHASHLENTGGGRADSELRRKSLRRKLV